MSNDDIVVSYEQAQAVMQTYITQGATPEEMKRRAALLKLEAATCEAAFKLLDQLGLDPDGHELETFKTEVSP